MNILTNLAKKKIKNLQSKNETRHFIFGLEIALWNGAYRRTAKTIG